MSATGGVGGFFWGSPDSRVGYYNNVHRDLVGEWAGAAVHFWMRLEYINNTFVNCRCEGEGGGIFAAGLTWPNTKRLEGNTFIDCYAHKGGGVYDEGGSYSTARNRFIHNEAEFGGGYYLLNYDWQYLPNYLWPGGLNENVFVQNIAHQGGGGVFVVDSRHTDFPCFNCMYHENKADGYGDNIAGPAISSEILDEPPYKVVNLEK